MIAAASSIALPRVGLTWTGYSRAGEATCFVIPERRWMFDCGCLLLAQPWRPACIFVTHTHADHIQALVQVLFRKKSTSAKATTTTIYVYVPAAAERALRAHLRAYHDLIKDDYNDGDDESNYDDDDDDEVNGSSDKDDDFETRYAFQLCPLEFHREITLPKSKGGSSSTEYVLRTIECDHRKVCAGYSIFQRRRVLKEAYLGLSGPELGQLAKDGGQLKEWGPLEPVLCFLGDTTARVFERHPEILLRQPPCSSSSAAAAAHTIVAVECTFYEPADVARAVRTGHMHWSANLQPVVERHPDTLFLLQHASLKHSISQWTAWVRHGNVESGHYNVHAMLAAAPQQSTLSAETTTTPTPCNCFVCCPRSC